MLLIEFNPIPVGHRHKKLSAFIAKESKPCSQLIEKVHVLQDLKHNYVTKDSFELIEVPGADISL